MEKKKELRSSLGSKKPLTLSKLLSGSGSAKHIGVDKDD
jgi:hypothetical protein